MPTGRYDWINVFVHWQTSVALPLALLSEITCCSHYNGHAQDGALRGRGQITRLALFQVVDDCRLGPDRIGRSPSIFSASLVSMRATLAWRSDPAPWRRCAHSLVRRRNRRPPAMQRTPMRPLAGAGEVGDPHESKKGDVSKERTDDIGRY